MEKKNRLGTYLAVDFDHYSEHQRLATRICKSANRICEYIAILTPSVGSLHWLWLKIGDCGRCGGKMMLIWLSQLTDASLLYLRNIFLRTLMNVVKHATAAAQCHLSVLFLLTV